MKFSAVLAAAFTTLLAVAALAASNEAAASTPASGVGEAAAVPQSGPDVKLMTLELVSLAKHYRAASAAEKPAVLSKLVTLARGRQQALRSLMNQDPLQVLTVSLSQTPGDQLPPEARLFVEQRVAAEGELEVLNADNFDTKTSALLYFLRTSSGRFSLHFAGVGPELLSGSKVAVRGVRVDDQIAVAQGSQNFQVVQVASEATAAASSAKVAVILFNFQNNSVEPFTPSYVQGVTFTNTDSVNAYYKEISFGKLSLEGYLDIDGDVFGWYTVPFDSPDSNTYADPSTNCLANYMSWSSAAKQLAAVVDGFDVSNYSSIVYGFPTLTTLGCPGGGWQVGSEVWVQAPFYQLRTVGHELGHTFGVLHASSYVCAENGVQVSISTADRCTRDEYGDLFDIMGSSTNHMNNFHKGRLGWFADDSTQTITRAGTYTVAQVEQPTTEVQALRIPRGLDIFGRLQYYYLEFRQAYGFDPFPSTSAVVNGVSIRLAPEYGTFTHTLLIDATPRTPSGFADAALPVGSVFEDTAEGIWVKTKKILPGKASVIVHFKGPQCVRANPAVSISPPSQWGSPDQTLSYTLHLTNNDSSACGSSSFSVDGLAPLGWSQALASPSVSLSPGSSTTITVGIRSATRAAAGFYSLIETVVNDIAPTFSATAPAGYNVTP